MEEVNPASNHARDDISQLKMESKSYYGHNNKSALRIRDYFKCRDTAAFSHLHSVWTAA